MAAKEKDDNTLIEYNSISFMVYFKGFFLLALVLVGIVFVNKLSKRNIVEAQPAMQSATQSSLIALKNSAKTYMQENINKDGVVKSLENTSGQVMGEATRAANIVVEKTTDTITDYVYQHTLDVVIVTLIEKIPDRQKSIFIENLCKNYKCKK
ncbi:hypothetical protein BH09PAT2_BH09PAT2_02790 [soil metagenome]